MFIPVNNRLLYVAQARNLKLHNSLVHVAATREACFIDRQHWLLRQFSTWLRLGKALFLLIFSGVLDQGMYGVLILAF
jgi:hypothetical protein